MKVALIHEWLTTLTGSEEVLACMQDCFPGPIHVLVADFARLAGSAFAGREIRTSFLQKLPFALRHYRHLLPLYPLAVEQHDLSAAELVLSSSHAVAKGVITRADQLHICYCHTPMRYAWDLTHEYLRDAGMERGLRSFAARLVLHYLRLWDRASADRVDHFIANSAYVAQRIRACYGREATVIHPPVDLERFQLEESREDYYLAASRFVPYKRLDLIAAAFRRLPNRRLLIVGEGPDEERIRSAAGPNVEIMAYPGRQELARLMGRARAFVFAALEDFGIVPVEAQACGTPVIAYGRGGARETVRDGITGCFFPRQDLPSLIEAVHRFEAQEAEFVPQEIRRHAEKFGRERFLRRYRDFVLEAWENFKRQGPPSRGRER